MLGSTSARSLATILWYFCIGTCYFFVCKRGSHMPPHTMNHHQNCRTARRGMPAPAGQVQLPPAKPRTTQEDLERLINTLNSLQMSGWYHGAMTYREAKLKLKSCSNGTFLVRDSSDDRYLYTLSVKTPRGTTSVRIEYEDGLFMLDSEESLRRSVPSFDCVIKLLQYYMRMSREKNFVDANGNGSTIKPKTRSGQLVWLEPSGRKDTEAQIIKPLTSKVPSLQHLCRCTVNKTVEPRYVNDLSIPRTLKKYVQAYPFSLWYMFLSIWDIDDVAKASNFNDCVSDYVVHFGGQECAYFPEEGKETLDIKTHLICIDPHSTWS